MKAEDKIKVKIKQLEDLAKGNDDLLASWHKLRPQGNPATTKVLDKLTNTTTQLHNDINLLKSVLTD